jgi:hypothetical protein
VRVQLVQLQSHHARVLHFPDIDGSVVALRVCVALARLSAVAATRVAAYLCPCAFFRRGVLCRPRSRLCISCRVRRIRDIISSFIALAGAFGLHGTCTCSCERALRVRLGHDTAC